MSLGSCAAVLKTASRANPAVHLPYRPRLRATPHRPSRNYRRYDWIASSGSVVGNDPVNKTDPTGNEGVVDGVVDWGKMVANDIVDLGKGLARGDFEWALGGMPPTLSGGANIVTAPIRAVNAMRISVATLSAARIESRALSLAARAGGNSVTVRTAGGFSRVDLAGKAHFSKELGRYVSTPHVQAYKENIVDGVVRGVSKVGDAVPATMKDLRAVEDVLKKLKP
jgi:hypothetical protein